MRFATAHRYPQDSLNYAHDYYYNDRNIPLTVANGARIDPRGYPLGGPVGGSRSPGGSGRDDSNMDSGQSRRRIAVACARCRKRKIRCSGDPGNGMRCTNCKNAGVESSVCQFHRVGSDHATSVLDSMSVARSMAGMATSHVMMPTYGATGGPIYSRAAPHSYPQLNTKATYPPTSWTVPFSEDTSPVEAYSLDQPPAYLPTQNTMTGANTYGSNYRWSQAGGKPYQGGANTYLDHESYNMHGLPMQVTTNIRGQTSEALSPLNMSALQLSLPGGPHQRPSHPSDQAVPQRQLPVPLPSPAQSSRNAVDQLQDQRLRSVQAIGRSAHTRTGAYSKPAMPFNGESEAQVTAEASAADLATQVTTSTSIPTADSTMSYLPITASVSEEATTSAGAQSQLHFSTSSLLETMPAPILSTTYSNFRNYNLPTSSSTETMPTIARQSSQTNLYSFSPDIKRRSAGGTSNDSALVSGHQYTPLNQSQSHHQSSLGGLQHDSFSNRMMPTHRASMTNLKRSF